MIDYESYIRMGEPNKAERARNWNTAIGLQAVDGLQTSDYLKEVAQRHIDGEIDILQSQSLIRSYYESRQARTPSEEQQEEADKVSANITQLLSEPSFTFSVAGLAGVHRRIFEGVFSFAGEFRQYDITKQEWVLRGDTVLYGAATELSRTVDYDLQQEREFSYKGLSAQAIVQHLAKFTADLWQIHPFREGNTRTTAVFLIKYLCSIGFNVDNAPFMTHSWYFRNALVRANYRNVAKGISEDNSFLIRFFSNLLLGTSYELRNRYMLVGIAEAGSKQGTSGEQVETADRTSTVQVPDKLRTSTVQVEKLVSALGNEQLSVREMLDRLELKHRENFLTSYLSPAMQEGFVAMLYPDSPRHPRQKYYLTVKGLALLSELS